MLISCPNCPKKYRVSASAIPPEGREVRCAHCQSVWHERGIEADIIHPEDDVELDSQEALNVLARLLKDQTSQSKNGLQEIAEFEAEDHFGTSLVASASAVETIPAGLETGESLLSNEEEEPLATNDGVDPIMSDRAVILAPKSSDVVIHQSRMTHGRANTSRSSGQKPQNALVDRVRVHWKEWRDAKDSAQFVPPGNAAASAFRSSARNRARNQLTPARAAGWAILLCSISAVGWSVIDQQERIQAAFPASQKVYARLSTERAAPLSVADVDTRYVESVTGPVLEIRGTVVNNGDQPEIPALELTAQDGPDTFRQMASISNVPLPEGGARPFIVRAQLPTGVREAQIKVAPAEFSRQDGTYVLQQVGSGWGDQLPEALLGAESN